MNDTKHDYIPIKTEFKSKGFFFRQLKREGDFAIYEQKGVRSGRISFEVIQIRRHDGYEIAGNKFPPAEMYPSSSQWGTFGWTYITEEGAEKKFKELQEGKAETPTEGKYNEGEEIPETDNEEPREAETETEEAEVETEEELLSAQMEMNMEWGEETKEGGKEK